MFKISLRATIFSILFVPLYKPTMKWYENNLFIIRFVTSFNVMQARANTPQRKRRVSHTFKAKGMCGHVGQSPKPLLVGKFRYHHLHKLESALHEELAKPNFSSRAEDYMKSEAYNKYKAYLCENTYYINLMFQSFLFTEPSAGLCGYLVDDIVRSRYPTAPSIRAMVTKTGNQDDETFAKLNYKKAVWQLMNKEREMKSYK